MAKRSSPTTLEQRTLQLALLLATGLLLAGLWLPLLTVQKMVLWKNTLSILSTLQGLWLGGHIMLLVLMTIFSVVLPVLKLAVLYRVVFRPPRTRAAMKRVLAVMHDYGRWAMLDVMVVAVLLVTLKLGALASVQVHAGLYVFAAAVVLIALITHRVTATAHTPRRRATR